MFNNKESAQKLSIQHQKLANAMAMGNQTAVGSNHQSQKSHIINNLSQGNGMG